MLLVFPYVILRPFASPREVSFVVIDTIGDQSNLALATINFVNVDNPPVLDLNGPFEPGRNFTTEYLEGADAIKVYDAVSDPMEYPSFICVLLYCPRPI